MEWGHIKTSAKKTLWPNIDAKGSKLDNDNIDWATEEKHFNSRDTMSCWCALVNA